jgi:lipoprotein NlpI
LADFNQAGELDPKSALAAVWIDIAGHRNKVPSRLTEAIKTIDMTKWPGPVIRLLLGQSTLPVLLAAADDPDAEKRSAQTCGAHFYGGEWALRQNDKPEAARLFRLAVKDCPSDLYLGRAARAELKAMGEALE